ncbi:caspase family protein [Actinomycetospora lutea]|uniref:caspase family protein n=1 Tax=Actinomycetospora lutea TaxID=663604 RepID=UPI00236582CF|nr:caspase family protein [Actinomycetospora lutea]MDD7942814.1 caspase family protein [Actinomycetospora lutea]
MSLPDFENSCAVLAGTSTYADQTLDDLVQVKKNVLDFAALLTDQNRSGFTEENCTSIVDPETPDAVLAALDQASQRAKDLLLFYFSGHGVLLGQRSDELNLALTRSDLSKFWTCLPYNNVARLVLGSSARTKVVLLDCCYSGRALGFMGASDSATAATEQIEIAGTYVMTATSKTKRALAPEGHEYTAFTGELLSVFRSGLQIDDQTLPLEKAFYEVSRRMRESQLPTPQQRNENSAGKLALVWNSRKLFRRTSSSAPTDATVRIVGHEPKLWDIQLDCSIGQAHDPLQLDEELLDSFIAAASASAHVRDHPSPLLSYLSRAALGGGVGELLREFSSLARSDERRSSPRLLLQVDDERLRPLPWEDCSITRGRPLGLEFACMRSYSEGDLAERRVFERKGPPRVLLIDASIPPGASSAGYEQRDERRVLLRRMGYTLADWSVCSVVDGGEDGLDIDSALGRMEGLEPHIVILLGVPIPVHRWEVSGLPYDDLEDAFYDSWVPELMEQMESTKPLFVIMQECQTESRRFATRSARRLRPHERGYADLGEALNIRGVAYALRLSELYQNSESYVDLLSQLTAGAPIESATNLMYRKQYHRIRLLRNHPWAAPVLSTAVDSNGQLFERPRRLLPYYPATAPPRPEGGEGDEHGSKSR